MARGTKGFGKATRNAASAVPRGAGGGAAGGGSSDAPVALAAAPGPAEEAHDASAAALVTTPQAELDDGEGILLARAASEGLLMDDSEYNDEVDNEFVRGRMENVVRVATGDDVRITFGQGFHTDMNGTVQLDPYDPSKDAAAEDRILMMQGGLEHEICHELYYDKAAFAELQRQIQADPSRAPVAFLNNILADGHDEWRHKLARPEAYEVIAAHDALFVQHNGSGRWSFDAENQDAWTQVSGAMLYRALPYYNVPEDKLSDEARDVYREVAPLVDDAVSGTSWDCLKNANEIYDRLDARGVLPKAPRQDHLKGGAGPAAAGAPGTGGGGGRAVRGGGQAGGGGGQAGGASGPEDEPLSGEHKGAFEDAQKKKDAESADGAGGGGAQGEGDDLAGDPASRKGSGKNADGAGGGDGDDADGGKGASGGSRSGKAKDAAQGGSSGEGSSGGGGSSSEGSSNAAGSAQGGGSGSAGGSGSGAAGDDGDGDDGGGARAGPRSSGSSLAADPDAAREALESRRRAAASMAAAARNLKPQNAHRNDPAENMRKSSGALETFRENWRKNRRLAEDFAAAIEEARIETAAPKSRQDSGRLDRRRKRALAVGDEKVFVRRGRARKTDMSVELLLDVSGSMTCHNDGLRDSAAIVSRGLDVADIPHEVRGFSGSDNLPLYRSFGEKADWKLGAIRASGTTALDAGLEKVRGGFTGRKEKQKLAVVLTDSEPDNAGLAKAQLASLRREGVTVVGLFLRPKEDPHLEAEDRAEAGETTRQMEGKMRDLFGGSVAIVDDVRQLPRVAGKKIVDLLRRS